MLKHYIELTCILAILTTISFKATGQADTNLVAAFNQQVIPITVTPTDTNFTDLEKLKPFLKDKQVFGLGEATHGTHEFFAFKHRMLQFLVKENGIKTFVIEGDFAGTQIMNDYVLYGKGDVNKGLTGIGFGVWMTGEVVDMVNWIRSYNAVQAPENKVTFWGCDMQWGSSAIANLKDFLNPIGLFTPTMEKGLVALNKYVQSLTKPEKEDIRKAVNELMTVSFTGVDSVRAAVYKHDVRELQQLMEYIDAKSTFFPAKQSDLRDQFMAENCEWIYNLNKQKKMMIWAHNSHINRSSGSDSFKRMGIFLSKVWSESYYAMGFDFYKGTMRTFDMKQRKNVAVELPVSKVNSTGAIFAQCQASNFILDLKSASADLDIGKFLNSKTQPGSYGSSNTTTPTPHYIEHKLFDTYDAVIFIRETSAAKDMVTLNKP